mgnify:FL=1
MAGKYQHKIKLATREDSSAPFHYARNDIIGGWFRFIHRGYNCNAPGMSFRDRSDSVLFRRFPIFTSSLDNFLPLGYNKNTRRCPLQTGIPPQWKPDGCHNIHTYWVENLILKTVSRLLQQTAHFFLSCRYSTRDTMLAMEPMAPMTAIIISEICIASLGKKFP